MNFLFSADLHGNEGQYLKLFRYATECSIPLIVLGGDLSPKTPDKRNPAAQRGFFVDFLFKQTRSFPGKVFLILGNDDYKQNLPFLKEQAPLYNFEVIDKPRVCQGFTFAGYSYVPYTPFLWKDWERRDLKTDTLDALRPDVRTVGKMDFTMPYDIRSHYFDHSIEEDLENLIKDIPQDNLILITHAPPFDTVCDQMNDGGQKRSIGSVGVRRIIEKYQPLLTLHGHIHDSAENAGAYQQHIKKTVCATVSNDHQTDHVWILDITPGPPPVIERKCL